MHVSCAETAGKPSDGRTAEEKVSDMAEDLQVLSAYYAPLCAHMIPDGARTGTTGDGKSCKVPVSIFVKRSDRQRGTDSHCWYDQLTNTATKIYFRATTTVIFAPDGVLF